MRKVIRWQANDGEIFTSRKAAHQHEHRNDLPKLLKHVRRRCPSSSGYDEVVFCIPDSEILCDVTVDRPRICFDAYVYADDPLRSDPRFRWHKGENSLFVHAADSQKIYRYAKRNYVRVRTRSEHESTE